MTSNDVRSARAASCRRAAGLFVLSAVSALSACDQKPPGAPTPRAGVEGTFVLTPGQTRAVEGLEPPFSIKFADVQARNTCGSSGCPAIFIPVVVLDVTSQSSAPVQRRLALPNRLATDDVPAVTIVDGVRIELATLEPTYSTPLHYRATFHVTRY